MSDLLDRIPYARFLGLTHHLSGDELTVTMPFSDHLIGNPMLPALHGGSTAALLEMTAMAQAELRFPGERRPRIINVTVAYLRSGRPLATHARAHIHRAGRRVASVSVEAWQEERSNPIATLNAHFLLNTQ
jgi:uncharacterized protein (TIGR00369 family)